MSKQVWIDWQHNWCPVPGDTVIFYKYEGRGDTIFQDRDDSGFPADSLAWAGITAFAIDPDQPAQLGGPLEVGATYIRRDGSITTLVSCNSCGYEIQSKDCLGYGVLHNGKCGGPTGMNPNKDLIARLYVDNLMESQRNITTLQTVLADALTEAAAYDAYLARRIRKCEQIQAMVNEVKTAKRIIRAPGSELADKEYARMGWVK